MSEIPNEFLPKEIEARSPKNEWLFRPFLSSGEPFKSLLENNPWLAPPSLKKPLEWGAGGYWETTVGRKHSYWKDFDLPEATKDIRQLRKDFGFWGYCLIDEGMSRSQTDAFLHRILEQAEAERIAGVDDQTPTGQYVNTLVNKGRIFGGCIEQDPEFVQAGPVIEQLLNESLGKGWICHSFLANGADPWKYPQGVHIDQGPLLPWITASAPALVNTMYIPQDVDDENGGTLIIPGSHKLLMEAGDGGVIGEVPRPINLEAEAGTIMVFDGRVIHGTGVNRTDKKRFVATMSNVKPWMRTQENWSLSVAPDVLDGASDKLCHRMGLQALTYGATVEGFGLGARGSISDRWGDIRQFRRAYDRGDYSRVRELTPQAAASLKPDDFTVAIAKSNARKT